MTFLSRICWEKFRQFGVTSPTFDRKGTKMLCNAILTYRNIAIVENTFLKSTPDSSDWREGLETRATSGTLQCAMCNVQCAQFASSLHRNCTKVESKVDTWCWSAVKSNHVSKFQSVKFRTTRDRSYVLVGEGFTLRGNGI